MGHRSVKFAGSKTEYFCDACETEISYHPDRDSIDQYLHKCQVCGKQVCYSCCEEYDDALYGHPDTIGHMCNVCFTPKRKKIVVEITEHRLLASQKTRELLAKLLEVEGKQP